MKKSNYFAMTGPYRLFIGLAILLISCNVFAMQLSEQEELERTWWSGTVFVPSDDRFQYGRTWEMLKKQKRKALDKAYPVIVYMHGCSGIMLSNLQIAREFALAGYVVVLPDSYARKYKPKSCDLTSITAGLHRDVLAWRHKEADYALKQVRKLPWLDAENVFLAGLSEGGVATATYRGESVNARIIEGWTCQSKFWSEYAGMNAPDVEPVLALVAAKDPWFYKRSTAGDCGPMLNKKNGSKSVVYREAPLADKHWLNWHAQPRNEMLAFITAHTKVPAGR